MPDPANPTGGPAAPPNNSPFHQPINNEAQRLAEQPPKQPTRIAAPTAAEQANMSPNERHRLATATPGDPATTIQVRGANGEVIFKDRTTGQVIDAGGAIDPDAPPIDPATVGEKFKIGEFEVSEAEVRDMLEAKAERDLARAEVPVNPRDYKIEIPAAANLPEGTAVTLKNDPESAAMIDAAQQWAHKHGLPQSAFNELVAIQAQGVVAGQQRYNELKAANLAALGTTGPQQIDGLVTWIRSQVGDADAKPIIATMATTAHVRFFQKLQHQIASQGVGSFNGSGRVVEERGVDAATYNSWSYGQKKEYAERASSPGNRRR